MIKILAIDDNNDNLISLKAILKDIFTDAAVFTALTGPEGIKLAAAEDPGVILLDIVMPGMDGFEVCRRIKEDPILSEIPVIFLTSLKETKENRLQALEIGVEAFLSKPIDETELTAQIRAMLKIKSANELKRNEKERLAKLVAERTLKLEQSQIVTLNILNDLKAENEARKQSEEFLRVSEERYRSLFSEMLNGFALHEIIYDKKGKPCDYRFQEVNPAFEKMTGLIGTEICGKTVLTIMPETEAYWIDLYGKVATSSESIRFENYAQLLGKYFEVVAYSPQKDKFATIFTDITERKHAKEDLIIAKEKAEESEAMLKFAQQSAGAGLWDWNMQTNLLKWSPELFGLFGFSPENDQASFENWDKCLHPDDKEAAYSKMNDSIKKHTQLNNEYRVVHPDGKVVWINAIGKTNYDVDGTPTRMAGICINITERKLVEIEFQKRESLLNKVFDVIPIGLWIADKNGKLLRGNPAGVKIWGAEPTVPMEEYGVFKGRRLPSRQEIAPDDWSLAHTINEGVTITDELLEIDAFDGQKKIILNYSAPVLDNDGNLLAAIVINSDITERKLAEDKIKNIKQSLEKLNKRNYEIRENERSLISTEIHDNIGQSLFALKFDLVRLLSDNGSDSVQAKKLKGMIELIDTISKDIQRISSELRPPMLDDLGLHQTMEWYIGEFKKRTGINCIVKFEDVQFPDKKKDLVMFRLLQESLTNVLRHANAKNVSINLYRADGSIILEIIDDGTGVPKKKIDSYQSLGFIGMRERIRQFDGIMDISSTPNKGTKMCFTISL